MARVRVLETEKRSPARRETDAALSLAQRLPQLVLEARRAAATLTHGIHGRRRAGIGETFWQFRPFVAGEAAQRIDWRRSGRDDRLYVREREWETAQTVWFWIDRSASMGYASDLAQAPKIERAVVLSPGSLIGPDVVRVLDAGNRAPAWLPSLNLRQNIDWTERETVRRAA